MTTGTSIRLGGVQIDDADFSWPLYTGGEIKPVIITVDAYRTGEFELLPYITTLEITCSGQDGTNAPAMETILIEGVRIIEVRKLNELATEIYLGDVRVDLARRVFPADFMMRWRDGYLDGTNRLTFLAAMQYLAELVPEFEAALAGDALDEIGIGEEFWLPDNVVLAGGLLLPGLEAVANLIGATISVGFDGLIRFVTADNDSAFPVSAYSWVDAMEPTWAVQGRTLRGLPKTIRCLYPERHQLILKPYDPQSTDTITALSVDFEWVYGFDDGYDTLEELLVYYGFSRTAITEARLAEVVTSENFEGTGIERDGSAEADDIISIIKRDWRQTARIKYPSEFGRRGGWTELTPGRLKQVTDKDGAVRYALDPEASPILAEWVQWFNTLVDPNPGDTENLYGCIVARGHTTLSSVVPPAPFRIDFVPGQDDVFRITYNQKEENTAAAWLGKIWGGQNTLEVTRAGAEDDTGGHVEHSFDMYIPEVSDLQFTSDFDCRLYFVATRQLPNSVERWTAIDIEGFPDGDVDVQELEVGEELHALYEAGAFDDAFRPLPLNSIELQRDAERRVRILKEDMAARLEGEGVAQGVAPVLDYVYPKGPVRQFSIEVDDSTVVFTRVVVGNRDSARARWDRSQKRKLSRKREAGGVPRV